MIVFSPNSHTVLLQLSHCLIVLIVNYFTLKYFRVIVLDKGLIVEYDSPEALLRNPSSSFYNMAKDAGLAA